MTAMDILEALGQTQEELLDGCDEVLTATGNAEAGVMVTGRKYRRAAAGLLAAAAVLLLVYVGGSAYMSRSFDSSGMNSTSTAESAEISADTAVKSAEEEAETVETEEEFMPESAEDEEGSFVTDSEEAQTATVTQTETSVLEILQLGEVYISGFTASTLSDSEYAEWMELLAQVQEEIDAALTQETYETLPVYRFVRTEEFTSEQNQAIGDAGAGQSEQSDDAGLNLFETDSDLLEKLGDYPVITAEEAEKLLWNDYYLSYISFSLDDYDDVQVLSAKLQYLISEETQIYMPYYNFTVQAEGDMIFICCVPAVSSEYLEGMLHGGVAE